MHIVRAHLGPAIPCSGQSHGDLWSTAWADDGALYSASDDTHGFDNVCNSNLAVNRITGDTPPNLQGKTINCMEAYGGSSEFLPADGGMWKANGITCLDGVLYMSVSRHGNNESGPFYVQEAWDSNIIVSHDYGRTWNPQPRLGAAMFPGHTFATPFFVQYGQDGKGEVDGAGDYIYAVSSNGVWNNGSSMTLGRVGRDRIEHLNPADWEFVHGYDNEGTPIWRSRHDTALHIFYAPGQASMTGIHYVAPLGLYIMPQWSYTHLSNPDRVQRWTRTRWDLYQSRAPWGPWTPFHSQEFQPQGWYNPYIVNKFTSEDGRSLWIFTAGEFATGRYYSLHMMQLTLEVEGSVPGRTGVAGKVPSSAPMRA
jgi:hypothetical protein